MQQGWHDDQHGEVKTPVLDEIAHTDMRSPSVRACSVHLAAPPHRIEYQYDPIEMGGELIGLISRQRGAHEPDDRWTASLMDGECVEGSRPPR